jgi:hypothetical protein
MLDAKSPLIELCHEVNTMIYQSPYWYDIVSGSGAQRGKIAGKWLYFDKTEKLHQLLDDLNVIVESGRIRAVKVARKLPEVDPFPEKQCVLCVYTSGDKEEKETVKKLLENELGISVSGLLHFYLQFVLRSNLNATHGKPLESQMRILGNLYTSKTQQIRHEKDGVVQEIRCAAPSALMSKSTPALALES